VETVQRAQIGGSGVRLDLFDRKAAYKKSRSGGGDPSSEERVEWVAESAASGSTGGDIAAD